MRPRLPAAPFPALPSLALRAARLAAARLAWCALLLAGALALAPAAARAQPADAPAPDLAPDTLRLGDLSAFRSPPANWQTAGGARANRHERRHLEALPGTGVLVNLPTDEANGNLFTAWEHGDLELELDVMMPKGSNSGLYLMGRYEVQLFDSWGTERPTYADLGGIYERWDDDASKGEEGYEGRPPRINAARAPGLWQRLRIVFRAPRFGENGRKTENARFDEVVLNGVAVHENVEVTGPTRSAPFADEQRTGPLMLQGDHGPVALRNVRYRRLSAERVAVQDVRYDYYEGEFEAPPDLAPLTPKREGVAGAFTQTVAERAVGFALVFRGDLRVPRSGRYRFALQAQNGGGRLAVGGRPVVDYGSEEGGAQLEAGTHPFELTYFKNPRSWSSPSLALFAEGPDMPRHELTRPESAASFDEEVDPIYVEAEGARPVVLRSFMWHGEAKRTRVASVGHPSGVHYAVDLGQAAPLYVWKGPFADATPMWHARGEAQALEPRGSLLALDGAPSVTRLPNGDAPWPDSLAAADGFALRGYELDEEGRPAFLYRLGGVDVEDRFKPDSAGRALTREVTFRPSAEEPERPQQQEGGALWLRVATAEQIRRLPDGSFSVGGDAYYVDVREAGGAEPRLRRVGGRQELLLPVPLGRAGAEAAQEGDAVRLSYDIIW